MGGNERRRQKKLMKKRSKDQARKRRAAQAGGALGPDPRKRLLAGRELPLHECLINAGWKERGIANIIISRRQPDGKITFGVYLVDIFCLGLKSSFGNVDFSELRYESELKARAMPDVSLVECAPDLAHHIIYGGIDYAARFGFKPDPDFKWSQGVLDERGLHEPLPEVEFGKDGKPLFISGPHDNMDRIIRQLEATAGSGNFEFIAEVR
jgi:hypothetical protein